MDKILYEDKRVKITNREIIFGEHHVYLAAIRALEIRKIRERARIDRVVLYITLWALPWMILPQILPLNSIIIVVIVATPIIWFGNRLWPFVIVAETQKGEEIVFSTFNKNYVEKIAQILANTLGITIHVK